MPTRYRSTCLAVIASSVSASTAALVALLLAVLHLVDAYTALALYIVYSVGSAAAAYYISLPVQAAYSITLAAIGTATPSRLSPLSAWALTAASPLALPAVVATAQRTLEELCMVIASRIPGARACACTTRRRLYLALPVPGVGAYLAFTACMELANCLCELWSLAGFEPTMLRGKPCFDYLVDVVVWSNPLDDSPNLEALLEKRSVED